MKLFITNAAFSRMRALGDAFAPLETGGVLLGWRDDKDRVVAGVIGPGPRALHGRYAFLPDHRWQVQQIDAAFEASRGDLDYLGDWHTHPGGIAEMSAIDKATLARLVRKNAGAAMLIGASASNHWAFGGWTQARDRLLQKSKPEAYDLRSIEAAAGWPGFDEEPYPELSETSPTRLKISRGEGRLV